MYLLSHAHTKIVLNDHEFTGWSGDDPPYEFEVDGDLIETTIGVDGGVYGLALANFGGNLMLKLSHLLPSLLSGAFSREPSGRMISRKAIGIGSIMAQFSMPPRVRPGRYGMASSSIRVRSLSRIRPMKSASVSAGSYRTSMAADSCFRWPPN